MKKEFMEPEMKRIELNLKERIAASGEGYGTVALGINTRQVSDGCTVLYVETDIKVGTEGTIFNDIAKHHEAMVAGRCTTEVQINMILNSL